MRCLLLLLLLFCGCSKKAYVTLEGIEMNIPYRILIKDPLKKEDLKEIKSIISHTFKEIDERLNGWNKDSEIAKWNSSTSTLPIKVSKMLIEILKLSNTAYTLTNGAFDPSLGKLIHAWKMSLRIGKILSKEEIEALSPALGWDKIIIHDDALQKSHPGVELDLDGISKGYFCDLCIKRLKNAGYKEALVEWGGEVKVLGGPFKVLIQDKITPLSNISVATSGPSYQIYPITISQNTLIYSHFIDIETLHPTIFEDIYTSKSVFRESCALADALATANYTVSTH